MNITQLKKAASARNLEAIRREQKSRNLVVEMTEANVGDYLYIGQVIDITQRLQLTLLEAAVQAQPSLLDPFGLTEDSYTWKHSRKIDDVSLMSNVSIGKLSSYLSANQVSRTSLIPQRPEILN